MNQLALLLVEVHSHSNLQPNEQLAGTVSPLYCTKPELSTPQHCRKFRCHTHWAAGCLSPKQASQHCSFTLLSRSSLMNFKTHDNTLKLKQLFANSDSLQEALCSWQHFPNPALDHLPGNFLCFFRFNYSDLTFSVFIAFYIKAVLWVPTSLLSFNHLHQGISRKTLPQLWYVRSLRHCSSWSPPLKPWMTTETVSCIALNLTIICPLFMPSFSLL